jgi:RsiW-degrading membrane proteinase PrsW (M82 family)
MAQFEQQRRAPAPVSSGTTSESIAVPPVYGPSNYGRLGGQDVVQPPLQPQISMSSLAPLRLMWAHLVSIRGLAAWFLLFAGAPTVLLQLTGDDTDIKRAAWGFAIYFALMWALVIHTLVRPESLSFGLVASVVLAEAVGGSALALFLEGRLEPDLSQLGWAVFGVGVPEELAKAAPIIIFMLLRPRVWTTRMFLFMGALSGLTFGVVEAVGYSSLYEQLTSMGAGINLTTPTVWRLLADSLFHGCCAGVAAYFVGLAAWRRDKAVALCLIGIGIAALLHGLYDRWSDNWFGTAVALTIVALFVGYVKAGDSIALAMAGDVPAGTQEAA